MTDINTIGNEVIGHQICELLNNLGRWGYYQIDEPFAFLDDNRPWWAYLWCCCYEGCGCCCEFKRSIIHTQLESGKKVTFVVWLELEYKGGWNIVSVDMK